MYLVEYRARYGRWFVLSTVGFIPALKGGAFSLYFRNESLGGAKRGRPHSLVAGRRDSNRSSATSNMSGLTA